MVVLDATIVNIALPSAQRALGFPNSDRQWVVTSYALAFGSLLLVGGRLGDMYNRKWVFITGLIGFAVASAIGGAAGSFVHPGDGPGAAGCVRRPPRAVGAGHPRQHVPGSARARQGVRRLRLGRCRRRRDRTDPRRGAHPVPVVAVLPVSSTWCSPRSRWPAPWSTSAAAARPSGRGWTGPAPCWPAPGCSSSSSASPVPRPQAGQTTLTLGSLVLGPVLLAGFVVAEQRSSHPLLPLAGASSTAPGAAPTSRRSYPGSRSSACSCS